MCFDTTTSNTGTGREKQVTRITVESELRR